MAVESAFLGTPSIYVNSVNAGTLKEVEKMGLMNSFRNSDGVIECIQDFLKSEADDKEIRDQKIEHLKTFMNPTDCILSVFSVS